MIYRVSFDGVFPTALKMFSDIEKFFFLVLCMSVARSFFLFAVVDFVCSIHNCFCCIATNLLQWKMLNWTKPYVQCAMSMYSVYTVLFDCVAFAITKDIKSIEILIFCNGNVVFGLSKAFERCARKMWIKLSLSLRYVCRTLFSFETHTGKRCAMLHWIHF